MRVRVTFTESPPNHRRGAIYSGIYSSMEARFGETKLLLEKFGVDIESRYRAEFAEWLDQGIVEKHSDAWVLSRDALLRVDSLLHQFFLPQHRDAKYV